MDARAALQQYFGFPDFRDGQAEIVQSVLSGRDALIVMPTGGGKSLCYQLPALLMDGVALVISPLIALMKDQVDALEARGIPATTINSTLSPNEQQRRIEAMEAGEVKLVYIAPERFGHRRFVDALRRIKISFVAVDEAHCVSQWGHDFRPDYLKIGRAAELMGRPQIAAFTATATPDVRTDIMRFLKLRDPASFVTGFARPNLSFRVLNTPRRRDKFAHLRELVRKEKTGVIYCATRKRVEEVAEEVASWGVRSIAYHAGMDDEARSNAQEEFVSGKADIAIATNAFGMGIDRSDIRFVAHFELPGSIEAYYQEAGRAGRDGKPSKCDLLFCQADRRVQEFFIDGSNPSKETIWEVWEYLRRIADEQNEVRVSIQALAQELGAENEMAVGSALGVLLRSGYAERFDIQGSRIRGTRLLKRNTPATKLEIDEEALEEKDRRDRARLQAVVDYGLSGGCRQSWILRYFGDDSSRQCGRCDWCTREKREDLRELRPEEMEVLRKALSGVARMSRRHGATDWEGLYGIVRICEVLCGRHKGPIRENGLHRLSTFGILAEQGMDFVRALLEECLRMGLLRSSGGERPTITLTSAGTKAMKGELNPELVWPDPDALKRRSGNDGFILSSEGPPDVDLLEALKRKRSEIAAARGVPPYQIFTNRALESLAASKPLTRDQALGLHGIGEVKASRVLPAFLPIIARYAKRSS